MVKSLPVIHVKIALVLQNFMGIVNGLQSSSLTINVQLCSSQDFDWATQELLFSPHSATPVYVLLKCESPTQFQIHG